MIVADAQRIPDLPAAWFAAMGKAGQLSENAFPFRPHETDDDAIRGLAERYNLSRANIVRILVHAALKDMGAV